MINSTIKDYRVSNVYYMLCYAFKKDKLLSIDDSKVGLETYDNFYDLFAVILSVLSNKIVKKGLIKSYILVSDETSIIKGRINVNDTLKKFIYLNKKLICEFDEYSSNNYLNQIIKSTMFSLITSGKVKPEYKKFLKKSYLYFQDIENMDISRIRWKSIKYNRNNKSYKRIINLCYMIVNGLIPNNNEDSLDLYDISYNEMMNKLFESFVREYYKKHYPQLNATSRRMEWKVDTGYMVEFIPNMLTDITLTYKDKEMIIDTKYYGKIFNNRNIDGEERKTLHRDNWNQINAYVLNSAYKSDKTVSGMLLYAKTDEEISPDINTSVMGNRIYVKTLDLTKSFDSIKEKLNKIADSFMNKEE